VSAGVKETGFLKEFSPVYKISKEDMLAEQNMFKVRGTIVIKIGAVCVPNKQN
jgi:hypothetical protein